jgi:hypothetical protein
MSVRRTIINPESGRPIKVGGQTYKSLVARGYDFTDVDVVTSPSSVSFAQEIIINPETLQAIQVHSKTYKKLIHKGYTHVGQTLYRPFHLETLVSYVPSCNTQTLRTLINTIYEYTTPRGLLLRGTLCEISKFKRIQNQWYTSYYMGEEYELLWEPTIEYEMDSVPMSCQLTICFAIPEDFDETILDPNVISYALEYNPPTRVLRITFHTDYFIGG